MLASPKRFLVQEDIQLQQAPPRMHWCNTAERAIQIFKNHFIAGICSVDPNFTLRIWDKLSPQTTITLNLPWQSRINPRLSDYAQLNGHYDFNRAPMAPPCTRVVAHEKPDQRASWAPRGVDGWFIGPVLDHYWCYRVMVIIISTVSPWHHQVPWSLPTKNLTSAPSGRPMACMTGHRACIGPLSAL
jgi:hypothetical protein